MDSLKLTIAVIAAGALLPGQPPAPNPAMVAATAEDHKDMMRQLGIKALRPGPSGRADASNSANYDESKANPFPDFPSVLTLKNGKKVTSAKLWLEKRRPESIMV